MTARYEQGAVLTPRRRVIEWAISPRDMQASKPFHGNSLGSKHLSNQAFSLGRVGVNLGGSPEGWCDVPACADVVLY